jgi:hypothetical protein
VSAAFEADHMVATHRLLTGSGACWTWRRMDCKIFCGCLFLFIELLPRTRVAQAVGGQLPVPTLFTDRAERVAAVFADAKTF